MQLRRAIVASALLVPVAVFAATLGGPLPGPLPLFPSTNWWNLDISAAPVDPGSASFVNFIGTTRQLHPDFGGEVEPGSVEIYGIPYIVVDAAQAKKTVQFVVPEESDGVDHSTETSIPFYPIPDEAITQPHWVEGGQPGNQDFRDDDRHILIVDKDNKHLYELFNVFYDGTNWNAYSGAFFDLNTNGRRPDGWTSADAAGLAVLPGLVRYDEAFAAAEIGHAFRFTVQRTNSYVYPASHLAGPQTAGALPMGARMRLKASKDISSYTPELQRIFRAMKKYGLIVADNGSNMYVSGAFDTRWDNDVLNPAFHSLTASDFEVVQLGWNPPSGPSLSVNDVTVNEGNAGSADAIFTVTLTPAATGPVTVNWATANGTATAPSDYTAVASTALTFSPGETTKTVAVSVFGDTTPEPSETFFVNLSGASGAAVSDGQGQGTITNDDLPSLSINDVAVTEGNAGTVNANFTVTLSPTVSGTVTVNWATANGTATEPSDYTAVASTPLTFTPGQSTKTVTVVVKGDTTYEPDETFFVNLSGASGATVSDSQGQGTITNDDLPSLSINDVAVTEGNAGTVNANFTVTLSPAATGPVSVSWATANGTATAPSDYASGSGSLTFSPGETTKTVAVTVSGDTTPEPSETFFVNLSGASGATLSDSQGQATISNDDGTPPAVSCPGTVPPGGSYMATVNAGSSSTDWVAQYAPGAPNTPWIGDYKYVPLPRPQTVTLTAPGPVGTYQLRLFANDGFTLLGSCNFQVSSGPALSINDVTVTEGNAGTVNASFTVTLSPTAAGTVTVNYATANGTATAPSDYTAIASTALTFAPGESTKPVTVVVNGDTASEPNETFFVNLSGASGATVSDAQGQGTITNDDAAPGPLTCPGTVAPSAGYTTSVTGGSSVKDWVAQYAPGAPNSPWIGEYKYVPLPRPANVNMTAPGSVGTYELRLFASDTFTLLGSCTFQVATGPALSINDVTVTEGNSGTVNASFTVTLSPTSANTVTVSYATANGTATAPSDYTAIASTTLTFAPGESTKPVTVVVNGDTASEPNETFFVNLTGASGATVSDAQGQGTITNDDAAPGPLTCPGTVAPNASYTTTVGTGSSSTDWLAQYTPGAPNTPWIGQYKYVPMPRPQTVTMTAPGSVGTYQLRLFANDTYTVLASCNFQVASGPALSIGDVTVTEGNAGTVNASFTVTLSPTSTGTVSVNWATANGTASAPTDYSSASGSLSFAAGEATKTVTVVVNGDTSAEANETFFVNLSGASGATVSDAQGQATITNDDSAPALTCPGTVPPNGSYTTTVSAGSSSTDWVAQFTPGSPNAPPWIGQYKYVPSPRPQTVTMTAPGSAGTYELRLFANDSYTLIGSCSFQVGP